MLLCFCVENIQESTYNQHLIRLRTKSPMSVVVLYVLVLNNTISNLISSTFSDQCKKSLVHKKGGNC